MRTIPTPEYGKYKKVSEYHKFMYKVNNTKTKNITKLHKQINKMVDRLINNHNIKANRIEITIGFIGNDLLNKTFHVCIEFNK